VPKVLANYNADLFSTDLKAASAFTRFEISRVIKHVVLGQKGFILKPQLFSVTDDRRGIEQPCSVAAVAWPNGSDDRRNDFCFRDDRVQGFQGIANDVPVMDPVLWCVTVDRSLGKNDQVRTIRSRLLDCRDYLFRVPGNIPVRCVDLADGDLHLVMSVN